MATIPTSQNHLASLLNLSKSTTSVLVGKGMPTTSLEDAQAWRKANLNPALRPRLNKPDETPAANPGPRSKQESRGDPDGAAEDFQAARTRREISEANQAEIAEAELNGKFLIKVDFERHLFTAGRMLRDTLTNCSRRVGAEVAGTTDPNECEAIIDREHRAALASFAQSLRMSLKVDMVAPD